VGVAADGQYWFITSDPQPYFYLPLDQDFASLASVQARTSGAPEPIIPVILHEILRLAPDMPIIQAATMEQTVNGLAGLFIFRLAAIEIDFDKSPSCGGYLVPIQAHVLSK